MDYKVIREFECNGKEMVIVKASGAAHIMDKEEWKQIFSKWHPSRWKYKKKVKHKKLA